MVSMDFEGEWVEDDEEDTEDENEDEEEGDQDEGEWVEDDEDQDEEQETGVSHTFAQSLSQLISYLSPFQVFTFVTALIELTISADIAAGNILPENITYVASSSQQALNASFEWALPTSVLASLSSPGGYGLLREHIKQNIHSHIVSTLPAGDYIFSGLKIQPKQMGQDMLFDVSFNYQ